MKIIYFLCFSFVIFIRVYSMDDSSKNDQLTNRQIQKTGVYLQQKYGMSMCGIGGGAIGGLNLVSVTFERKGKAVTIEEARAMIIDCTHTYIKDFNENQALHSYFKEYPLTEKNFALSIIFEGPNCEDFMDPILAHVGMNKGYIYYDTMVYKPQFGMTYFQKLSEETYDEALAILKLQKPVFDKQNAPRIEK
jgi:hypothetical protein